MTGFFLGVDVGGTKSQALVADGRGRAFGLSTGGPGNYEDVGWDGLRRTLQRITDEALADADISTDLVVSAGFGVAGYDWPGEREKTCQAIDSLGFCAPYALVNDTIIGLLAGASESWGVVVVAGTSNNCRGRDRQGREGRVTGCGPYFSEYGGAAELVGRAVQAVARAWSGRGPTTRLADAFIQRAGATDVADLLEGLSLRRYHLTAAEAPLVFEVAAEGDEVAQETVQWAGRELGDLAVGVIRQLGFEQIDFEVVLAGSLYDGGPMLIEPMRRAIHGVAPGACLVRLTAPPVVGAVLLAMEHVGMSPALVRQPLLESATALIQARSAK